MRERDILEKAAAGCGFCVRRLVEVSEVAVVDALLVPRAEGDNVPRRLPPTVVAGCC